MCFQDCTRKLLIRGISVFLTSATKPYILYVKLRSSGLTLVTVAVCSKLRLSTGPAGELRAQRPCPSRGDTPCTLKLSYVIRQALRMKDARQRHDP